VGLAPTGTVQGSLHVQRREDAYASQLRDRVDAGDADDRSSDLDQPPQTPPPSIPTLIPASIGGVRSARRSPPSRRKHEHTPDRALQLGALEDSLVESDGPDNSLNLSISMLSSSMTSASAAPTSALMLTMGKMKKKEGHGIMAKESPVNCWIEDNFFVLKGEGDDQADRWDLGQCKVVPPHRLDRIKLQMTSSTGGTQDCQRLCGSASGTALTKMLVCCS
jgi:hypothetical protein